MEWRKNSEQLKPNAEVTVLILVLMEWRKNFLPAIGGNISYGFNPCSNGMKKERICVKCSSAGGCFNPCSNGMKKERDENKLYAGHDCFNPCSNGMKKELIRKSGIGYN